MNILARLEAQLAICIKKLDKDGIEIYTKAIQNVKAKIDRF